MSDTTLLVGNRAEVVVDARSGLFAVPAALLPEYTPPGVVPTDPPCCPICHHLTDVTDLVSEETMPKLWVIMVGIKQRVRTLSLHDLTLGDWGGQPPIVGLASKLQNPTRHRHGNPRNGELLRDRVEPFPGRFACDRYAAARRNTSFS